MWVVRISTVIQFVSFIVFKTISISFKFNRFEENMNHIQRRRRHFLYFIHHE